MKWNDPMRLSHVPYIDVRPEDDIITASDKALAVLDQYLQDQEQKERAERERRNRPFFGRLFG